MANSVSLCKQYYEVKSNQQKLAFIKVNLIAIDDGERWNFVGTAYNGDTWLCVKKKTIRESLTIYIFNTI